MRIEPCKKIFLSADYLSRLFKKEEGIGIGISYWRKDVLAKELLKEGKLSIARVAYECGYDNYSYFTKIFKKNMDDAPGIGRLEEKESAD
ncbi:MAG: helix-turn-helix domain-containing protein [Eisenbergiella massiliensis]